jgi:hypothetical protein
LAVVRFQAGWNGLDAFVQPDKPKDSWLFSDNAMHSIKITGYRGEDAKEKKSTMDTYWVPGVNNLKQYGRWAFAEFTDVFQMQDDFAEKVATEFNKMIETLSAGHGQKDEREA